MDATTAARRWAETWEWAWPAKDVDALAGLYVPDASYRALAFREPTTPRAYLEQTFADESDVRCFFAEPIVDGDRAAVEWWASWVERGEPLTLAGTTILRFDGDGLVTDHRDYWNEVPRREPPYDGWA